MIIPIALLLQLLSSKRWPQPSRLISSNNSVSVALEDATLTSTCHVSREQYLWDPFEVIQRTHTAVGSSVSQVNGHNSGDNKAALEPSYLCLKGTDEKLSVWPLSPFPVGFSSRWRRGRQRVTHTHLSIVGHDDQLHVLGRRLSVAFMLQEGSKGGAKRERRVNWKRNRGEGNVVSQEVRRAEERGERRRRRKTLLNHGSLERAA